MRLMVQTIRSYSQGPKIALHHERLRYRLKTEILVFPVQRYINVANLGSLAWIWKNCAYLCMLLILQLACTGSNACQLKNV